MRLRITHLVLALTCVSASVAPVHAGNVLFGTGSNQFTMEFVTIGNPGNAPDTDPNALPISNTLGSVGYTYEMGKFEVSVDMIDKYNTNFGIANSLVITRNSRGTNKPATDVSWNEAARFVNWLNTSTGGHAAYKFTTNGVNDDIDLWTSGDAGYDASNPYRNNLAKYVLPSTNEWHKAAYYDPNKNGGSGGYWDYPTGSDTAPMAVASGTVAGTAVYNQTVEQGPADVNQAGGLSPYGVMGLGGNAREWEESSFDLANSSGSSFRAIRSSMWFESAPSLLPRGRNSLGSPFHQDFVTGFRVVSLDSLPGVVPEPSMMVIGSMLGIGGLIAKRRMRKQPF